MLKLRFVYAILAFSILYGDFAEAMEDSYILKNGSSSLLSEFSFFETYEIKDSINSLPLNIKIPSDFDGFKYVSVAISQSKNSGGWKIIASITGNEIKYCLTKPDQLSPVTMAFSTPYLIVGHNIPLKIRESFGCF